MPMIYTVNKFDYPRRKNRIAWYVEILCAELQKKDKIRAEDVDKFWGEVDRIKKEKLPFNWQRERINAEARGCLDKLMKNRGERI